ncbi:receptor-like protein kinase FERONIA [Ipomoea triloba]|uniref:receptor-like protein kinase FERONIA n=1 Tax=Ipomoea triloba TaxID=35885 RepID=UPI00125DA732|nr:receptor-like protein kinase FERONIA [Ipomoea triloba]
MSFPVTLKLNEAMLSLIIFVVLHLITTASGGSPPYTPINHILHNCGAPSEQDFKGRTWKTDDNYPECLPANEIDISVTQTAAVVGAEVPYGTVHIFRKQCTRSYPVSPGLMFIRLHFNPTNYTVPGIITFQPEDYFFSVTANEYTLLANFSAFLFASVDNPIVEKEYVVNVNADRLNITFTPSPNSVAFVNGIEIVSIPTGYYIRGEGAGDDDNQIKRVGADSNYYYLFNNTALETLHRLNVGGQTLSPVNDTGMDRTWYSDDEYLIGYGYFTPHLDVNITYTSSTPAYSAPEIVYTSSRTIANYSNAVNWTFPVDSGFLYLFRLYFCEFAIEIDGGNERVFSVDIANKTAESHVDVFLMAGGSKIPIFRDYLMNVSDMDGRRNKQNVSFTIRPNMTTRPVWANALLNGLEIFKLNNTQGSMAVPNPERLQISVNPAPPAGRPGWSRKNPKNKRFAAVAGGAAGGVAVVVILVFLVNLQRKRATRDSAKNLTRSSSSNAVNDSSPEQSTESCRHFSLDELKSATADFDESYVIGKGGFGKVYRASINQSDCSIEDGENCSIVAVKRLNKAESKQGENEFWMEIKMLSRLRNQNLVSLIGYCNEDQEMLLVYEFMARGTLADHLYKVNDDNRPSLSWEQRLNICLGAARGLHYLHARKVIHRDVKTSNILLDQDLVAKISDFGLSKTGPGNDSFTHITTDVKGTFGYLDPEYFLTKRLTTKSDVFAFGVVLFEVLSGRPALDMKLVEEQHSLATWAVECIRKGEIDQMFEGCLVGKMSPACWKVFVEIAGRCLRREPRQRPDMADVVKNLELAVALQQRAAELALNVSIIGSDNPYPSKGWRSYLLRSHLAIPTLSKGDSN